MLSAVIALIIYEDMWIYICVCGVGACLGVLVCCAHALTYASVYSCLEATYGATQLSVKSDLSDGPARHFWV